MFAAVMHLVKGLSLDTLLTLNVEKSLTCLVTSSIHNGTNVNFVLKRLTKKASRFCRLE
jgi:hypothetical protein